MRKKPKKRPRTEIIPELPCGRFLHVLPRFASWFLLLELIVISVSAPLHAAGPADSHDRPYALIFGTVWGPDNRPVYGVRVRVRRSTDNKPKWELFSDHNGEFAVRVPAGKCDYVVWADLKGFKSSNGGHLQAVTEVTVHIENDERADIGLHLK
jgi:hypothetical protein